MKERIEYLIKGFDQGIFSFYELKRLCNCLVILDTFEYRQSKLLVEFDYASKSYSLESKPRLNLEG